MHEQVAQVANRMLGVWGVARTQGLCLATCSPPPPLDARLAIGPPSPSSHRRPKGRIVDPRRISPRARIGAVVVAGAAAATDRAEVRKRLLGIEAPEVGTGIRAQNGGGPPRPVEPFPFWRRALLVQICERQQRGATTPLRSGERGAGWGGGAGRDREGGDVCWRSPAPSHSQPHCL